MNKSLTRALAAAFASASLMLPLAVSAQGAGGTAGGTSAGSASTTAGATTAGSRAGDSGRAQVAAADRRFVEKAAEAGLAEVATGKLAQQKGSSSEVKQFAQQMVDDHTAANDRLKTIAQGKGVEVPTEPDRKHQRMMDKLAKLEGDKFDREYMRGQVSDHKDTVRLFERQAKSGKDADLKAYANETLPKLREHLQMAQNRRGDHAGGQAGGRAAGGSGGMGTGASGAGAGAGASAGGASGTTGAAGSTAGGSATGTGGGAK